MSPTDADDAGVIKDGDTDDDPWRFPDRADITIVCGTLHDDDRGPYVDPADHNYIAAHEYADIDTLIDLVIHVSAANPGSRVSRTRVSDELTLDRLRGHVILLGNMAWLQLKPDIELSVRPIEHSRPDGETFELDGAEVGPDLDDPADYTDVGLLWRGRNPYDPTRTMTICSGVFTRGVVGAVRALTDPDECRRNATFLMGR